MPRKHNGREAGAPTSGLALAALLLLVVAVPWQHRAPPPQAAAGPSVALPLTPLPSALRAAEAAPPQNAASAPTYDEQVGSTFVGNFTSLAYNVTVLAQRDADGFGPGYILNGFTPQDYFYQVAVSYDWPDPGPFPGFGFGYDVFGPSDAAVYPTVGGSGLDNFSGPVDSGDKVLLSLSFANSSVVMMGRDWQTGATAQTSFSSEGATDFTGNSHSRINFEGYFTGLMTEWYHQGPYSGSERGITYASSTTTLSSAWMWVDEFDTVPFGPVVFTNDTLVSLASDHQVYPYYADGALMSVSAHQFTTGIPAGALTSSVTLSPAPAGASPTFTANYTLSGQPQVITIPSGQTVIPSDPGASITISVRQGQNPLERWAFDGVYGAEVTVSGGENASFAVYHLMKEFLSYQVSQAGSFPPAGSAPELRYEIPPPVASATRGETTVTQVLGTDSVAVYALIGTEASVNGTIPGLPGERWATSTTAWSITDAGLIPFPVEYYHQYQVTIAYSVLGGGQMPAAPQFSAAAFGALTSVSLSGSTTGWFDAGSAYSFTGLVAGPLGTERWEGSGPSAPAPSVISSPGQSISEAYSPQYLARLSVNDAKGGTVYNDSGWFGQGATLTLNATANRGWSFHGWNGSGTGAYSGGSPFVQVAVAGPVSEVATFYVQLTIAADGGTNVDYAYPTHSGSVRAGTTETLDLPPSNVTLRASPSLFIYSFASWQSPGGAKTTGQSLVISVDSPSAVAGMSTYDYAGVLVVAAGAVALAANVVAGSLFIRARQRRRRLGY